MEEEFDGIVIDIPEIGNFYKSFGDIYKCVAIEKSGAARYIMKDLVDGSTHPFQKWGWKKVAGPSND